MAKLPHQDRQLLIDWTAKSSAPPSTQGEAPVPLKQATLPGLPEPERRKPARKPPAVLPVPKPLPSAIGKGNFGEDERGPVRPTAAEVRAITEHHAEKLIDLLGRLQDTDRQLARGGGGDRTSLIQQKDRVLSAYQSGIALYAEDFGEHAAQRLDAYVRHQVGKE